MNLAIKNYSERILMIAATMLVAIVASLFFALSTEAASYKEGDILYTNSTSSFGVTGHAGIVGRSADGSLYAVHIPGPDKPIQKITLDKWNKTYSSTEIWRHTNQTAAVKAGQKSMDFVRYYGTGSSYVADYGLFSSAAWNLLNKDKTYCSKLVWQSYYLGGGLNLGFNPNTSQLVTPRDLRGLANMYQVK